MDKEIRLSGGVQLTEVTMEERLKVAFTKNYDISLCTRNYLEMKKNFG